MKLVQSLPASYLQFILTIVLWNLAVLSDAVEKPYGIKSVYVSPSVTIDVGGKTIEKGVVRLREGDDIILTCLATGHPNPRTKWKIVGGDLENRPIDLDSPELKISKIQRNEGARISCKAENGVPSYQFAAVRLDVLYLSEPNFRLYKSKNSYVATSSMWFENTIFIRCETRSNPVSVVTWYKDGRVIKPQSASIDRMETREIDYGKQGVVHLLKILSASERHYGTYECKSSLTETGFRYNISDTTASFTFNANTAEPEITVVTPERVVANRGQEVVLDCRVLGGDPLPDVAWIRGDKILSNAIYSSNKKLLLLPEVQESDAGSYFCVANNHVGNPVKKMVDVIVRYINPMTYWITPDSLSDERKLELQRDIKLTCHTDAQPPEELRYSWFKKNQNGAYVAIRDGNTPDNVFLQDLKTAETRRFLIFPAYSSRLEIRGAKLTNYGTYVCRARLINGINDTQAEATIVITQDSAPAQVSAVMKRVNVVEGYAARLECKSKGRPVPQMQWVRDGNVTIDDERVTITNDGKLIIHNVSKDDEDAYTCIPARVNGFSQLAKTNKYADIFLNVDFPPEVVPSYTVIRQRLESKLRLSCTIMSAKPERPVTFTWNKNGRTVSQTSGDQMTILPLQKENYGLYECVVSNPAGKSRCLINVTGAAYAPEFYYKLEDAMPLNSALNLASVENGSNSFNYILSWTQKLPQAVDRVIEYSIRWRRIGMDIQERVSEWIEKTKSIEESISAGELITYEMQGLAAGEYEVVVTPRTKFGSGDPARRTFSARRKSTPQTTLQGSYFFCQFNSPFMCGFTQEYSRHRLSKIARLQSEGDDFDWTFNSANTQIRRTDGTGPRVDHSTSSKDGGYMYIESSNTKQNDRARLVSPTIGYQPKRTQCLRFFYHMWGRDIGRLNVILKSGNERILWTKEGEQGNQWIPAPITFAPSASYQIIFEAFVLKKRDFNYMGDIAIDDVTLENGPCPTPSSLSAEPWKNSSPGNSGSVPRASLLTLRKTLYRFSSGLTLTSRYSSDFFISLLLSSMHYLLRNLSDLR